MAFRLRQEESVAHGLRRLAKKSLRAARDELRRTPPSDEGIHEARKHVKKVRAIGELIEADGGSGSRSGRKGLRRVNRSLSRLRDADAMIAILDKLKRKNPQLFDEHTFARLRRRLSVHKRESEKEAADHGVWKKLPQHVRRLLKDVAQWDPTHRQFGALAPGIRAAHRRGRKALARAQRRQDAADFHDWRKQVKTLWYDLRLLEGAHTAIRRDVRVLHNVETWLGDDHNVVVLSAELAKDASCDIERLRQAGARYQRELRRKAITAAAPIYRRSDDAFVRHVRRAWRAWKGAGTAGRARRRRRAAA